MTFLFWLLGGIFFADLCGAWWHRHIAHLGALSWIAHDGIRAHHHNHHVVQHGPAMYHGTSFRLSCETSVAFLGAVLLIALLLVGWAQLLSVSTVVALLIGIGLNGAALKQLHHLDHIEEALVRDGRCFRHPLAQRVTRVVLSNEWIWSCYKWVRDCHEVHHYALVNFGIFPLTDRLLGTYADPKRLPALKAAYKRLVARLGNEEAVRIILTRRLFPGLALGRTSDCMAAMSENAA